MLGRVTLLFHIIYKFKYCFWKYVWSLCLSYPLRSWRKLVWQVRAAEILHFPSSKRSLLSLCKFVVACISSKFCLLWKYVFDQSCNVYVIVKIVSLNVVCAVVLQMCVFILVRNHVQERILLLLLLLFCGGGGCGCGCGWGVSVVLRLIEIQGGEEKELSRNCTCCMLLRLCGSIFFLVLYTVVVT